MLQVISLTNVYSAAIDSFSVYDLSTLAIYQFLTSYIDH